MQDCNTGLPRKIGSALLAVTLWTSFTFAAPDVHHLTARADDNKTTAYKKRLAETQKRKEMLAQA